MINIKLSIFLILLVLGCSSHQTTTQNTPEVSIEKEAKEMFIVKETKEENDGIVFLFFKIMHDKTHDENKVTYIKNIATEGKLKNNIEQEIHAESTLTINVFRNEILDQTITIDHPLCRNMEYLTENKTFARKEVVLEEAEFSIRIPNKNAETIIKISETTKNNKNKLLNNFKL
jgi:hypothetical protein